MRPKTKGVLTFLLISFALAWGGILVAHFGLGLSMGNPLVQLPMAFSPAIAAVIVRAWVTREGFRDAGLRPRVRAARRYYLLAWLGPVLILAATVGLAVALGLYRLDFSPLRRPLADMGVGVSGPAGSLLLLALPVLMMPIFWGEEFGWRGYLQLRVSRRPAQAAIITGVIWAAWHYPLAFTDYIEYPNPLLGILTWTLATIPDAIILAWLFLRSGSVWVPSLAHAGHNLVLGTLSFLLLADGGGLSAVTIDLLEFIPVAVIGAWILLSGQLKASADAGERLVNAKADRKHAAT